MLPIGKHPRVHLSRIPTHMRCPFEVLSDRVPMVIEQDPLSGHLFVFLNRQRDYIKVPGWDDGGYCIWRRDNSLLGLPLIGSLTALPSSLSRVQATGLRAKSSLQ
jgi:transposase